MNILFKTSKIFVTIAAAILIISTLSCSDQGNTKIVTETEYVDNTPDYTKTLVYNGCFKDGENGVTGLAGALYVKISSDGKNVYVTGKTDSTLAVFDRDTETGTLAYSTCFTDGTDGVDGLGDVREAAISPDNKNVYVAGYSDNSLAVFNRDTTTGALTYSTCFTDGTDGIDGLIGPIGVTVSPDNKNVYISTKDDCSLAVFNRDTVTGALSYSTYFADGTDGVDGLDWASAVVVSPDNKNVYVIAVNDDSIAVFDRDTGTGALSYSTCFKDNTDGVDGLRDAGGIAVSPDNKTIYVAAVNDNSIAVFDRDTETGALTYSTWFKDGTDGVDGLTGAYSVAVSPDNESVYVAGSAENSIAVFDRNTTTGGLTYVSCLKNGTAGVEALQGARCVAISPDNTNIYVTGRDDNALALFLSVKIYDE